MVSALPSGTKPLSTTSKFEIQTPFCSPHSQAQVRFVCSPPRGARYVFLPVTTAPSESGQVSSQGLSYLQETIIYAVSGKGLLLSQPKGNEEEPERHELGPGDFAFIPAWTEHQAVNESEVDFHLVLIRSGGKPVEVNLTDWGGPEAKVATS